MTKLTTKNLTPELRQLLKQEVSRRRKKIADEQVHNYRALDACMTNLDKEIDNSLKSVVESEV